MGEFLSIINSNALIFSTSFYLKFILSSEVCFKLSIVLKSSLGSQQNCGENTEISQTPLSPAYA